MSNFVDFVTARRDGMPVHVHNGTFHADDVLSVALLRTIDPSWRVVRTRTLPKRCFAVDVGGGLYDHHQRIVPRWDTYDTAHCGASRLFTDPHFRKVFGEAANLGEPGFRYLEKNLLVPVAQEDNGREGASPLSWVRYLNPAWNSKASEDESFEEAVGTASTVLSKLIDSARAAEEAESELADLRDTPYQQIPAGLPGWQERLAPTKARFVTYKKDGTWYVQAVPVSAEDRFSMKTPHPESWRGLQSDALSARSGIPGAVFCHPSGFISGWKDPLAAHDAAELAMRLADND